MERKPWSGIGPLQRLFRLQIAALVMGVLGLLVMAVLSRFSGFSSGLLYLILFAALGWLLFDPRWLRFILSAKATRTNADREWVKEEFHKAGQTVPEWYWVDDLFFRVPVLDAAFGGARFRTALLVPQRAWESATIEQKQIWIQSVLRQSSIGLPRLHCVRIWLSSGIFLGAQFLLWISGYWFLGVPVWFLWAWALFEKFDLYWSEVFNEKTDSRLAIASTFSAVALAFTLFFAGWKSYPQIELTWTVYIASPDALASRLPELKISNLKVLRRIGIEERLLRKVVREGSLQSVKALFVDPMLFSYQDEYTRDNWLHLAAREGRADLIPFFLKNGVSARAENRSALMPTHVAAVANRVKVLEAFRMAGLPLAEANSRGQNVLHLAAQAGALETLEFLFSDGWNVEVKDLGGRTPLMFAVQNRQTEAARRLLIAGASPNIKDLEGVSAMDLAEANRLTLFPELVQNVQSERKRVPSSVSHKK